MTAKIENGDYVTTNNGSIVEISGDEEILQRALFRLKAHQNEFELDKSLGSKIYKYDLKTVSKERLFSHITEILMPIDEIYVVDVEKSIDNNLNKTLITVYIKLNNKDTIIEFEP